MKKYVLISWLMLVLLPVCLPAGAYDRDSWQKPEKVMNVIGVKPGLIIGVAGAGHGYFSFKMAKRVGEKGHIYANEISQRKIDYIENRCKRENIKNISTILGEVEDPLFPPAKMDMVFMCYVFHDLAEPVAFLKNITKSLKPNAPVVIMEQDPGKTGSHHFLTQEEIRRKVKAAGYEIFRMETFLEKDNIYMCRPRKSGLLPANRKVLTIRSPNGKRPEVCHLRPPTILCLEIILSQLQGFLFALLG